jgi:hypothetical protein
MRGSKPVAAVAALALLIGGADAIAAGHGSDRAPRPPKIGEVDYSKQSGEQGPATRLEIYGRHVESVKLKASYAGTAATAIGKPFTHVDTHRYGHPWVPDPKHGRRDLLNVMKQSIAATGAVTLKVIASNDVATTKVPVQIVLSDCHLEPPLYPFTCVVKP